MSGAYDWSLGPGEYLLGISVLVVVLTSAALIGWALRRRLLPGWDGPPSWLAIGLLASACLVLSAELLGLFGLFTRPAYLVLLLALAAGAGLYLRAGGRSATALADRHEERPAGAAAHPPGSIAGGRLWLIAAALIAALVFGRALWTTVLAYDGGMSGFDTHWYHGPFTALFLQSGDTFVLNNSIAPQYLSWFYPHNSELLHAIAALPFDRDLLSPALNLLWLAGSMLAAWCIGRPFGVAPLSLIGACLILGSGLLSDQAGEMRNDLPAVFFVLTGAAIAINAWLGAAASGFAAPTGRASAAVAGGGPGNGALIVVGLAAGLAAGTKLNYLATAGALVIALATALPKGCRWRGFGLLFGSAFLGGGYWYLRNLLHSGNPLPWITTAGPIDLPGPSQEIGGREAHGVFEYLLDAEVWRNWFLPGLREALTLAWPLVILAAVAAVFLLLLRPRLSVHENHPLGGFREPIPLATALAATILATVGAWLVAPASAEGPAGEPVGFVSGLRYLAPALALALALLPVAIGPRSVRRISVPFGPKRGALSDELSERRGAGMALVVAASCLAALALLGGFFLQRAYLEHRYAEPDFSTPGLNRAFAEASRTAPKPEGAPPIAVNSTRIYAFFGPDLHQPVAYVGIAEPHGGFRRPEDCAEWRRAVNETGAEKLIVAWDRITPGQPPLPPEAAWTATDPAATSLAKGGGAASFRLDAELEPGACP